MGKKINASLKLTLKSCQKLKTQESFREELPETAAVHHTRPAPEQQCTASKVQTRVLPFQQHKITGLAGGGGSLNTSLATLLDASARDLKSS